VIKGISSVSLSNASEEKRGLSLIRISLIMAWCQCVGFKFTFSARAGFPNGEGPMASFMPGKGACRVVSRGGWLCCEARAEGLLHLPG
jgi:hypothetical protein